MKCGMVTSLAHTTETDNEIEGWTWLVKLMKDNSKYSCQKYLQIQGGQLSRKHGLEFGPCFFSSS